MNGTRSEILKQVSHISLVVAIIALRAKMDGTRCEILKQVSHISLVVAIIAPCAKMDGTRSTTLFNKETETTNYG